MILCSGELYQEPIDEKTCLECARKGNPPCGMSYPLVKALLQTDEDRSGEIHVSDLTSGCLRKSYLDKVDPAPEYVHDKLYKMIGQAVHEYIERANSDDPHLESEKEVSRYGVVGRIDAILDGQIIDFKTTRWLDGNNLPYGNHSKQVNFYRGLEEGITGLSINYIDVSGPPRCRKCKLSMRLIDGMVSCPNCGYADKRQHLGSMIVEVPVQDREEVREEIKERAEALARALETKEAPNANPGWICDYCPHTSCEYNPNSVF